MILRKLELFDTDDFFKLNSDPEVVQYLGIAPLQIEEALKRVESVLEQYEKYGIGRWAVLEQNSGNFIGFGGLKFFEHAAENYDNIYDLGYVLMKSHWGKGFATEISKAWLDYGFNTMQLPEIYGMTDPDNIVSKKILKKVGMHFIDTIIFEGMETTLFRIKSPDKIV